MSSCWIVSTAHNCPGCGETRLFWRGKCQGLSPTSVQQVLQPSTDWRPICPQHCHSHHCLCPFPPSFFASGLIQLSLVSDWVALCIASDKNIVWKERKTDSLYTPSMISDNHETDQIPRLCLLEDKCRLNAIF